jgi:hypothetical protein
MSSSLPSVAAHSVSLQEGSARPLAGLLTLWSLMNANRWINHVPFSTSQNDRLSTRELFGGWGHALGRLLLTFVA